MNWELARVMAWMMLIVGTGSREGETGRAVGCLGKGLGEGRWARATGLSTSVCVCVYTCVCICMHVCVYVGKNELLISRLLRGLSHYVPMAQLAPALTIRNPWHKARKTGWCSECV